MNLIHLLALAIVSRVVISRTYHGFDYPIHTHSHYPDWNHKPSNSDHKPSNWDHKPNDWEHKPSDWRHKPGDWGPFPWSSQESSEENSWEEDKLRNHRSTSTSTTTKTIQIRTTITNGTVTSLRNPPKNGEQLSTMDILMCLRTCPVRPEYRPVCGDDNMTYGNPSRLQCAINCGVDVALSRPGPCLEINEPTPQTANRLQPNIQSLAVIQACIRSCPVTSEYNPVCGTDSVTYDNPGRLECARDCGKPVSLFRPSRCQLPEPPQDPSPPNNNATTTTTRRPATNSMISSSTDAAVTSVTPTRFTNIFTPTDTPLQPNTNSNRPSTNGLNFTIPQNILDNIFNNLTTTEDTPDYSFDERYE